MGDYDYWNTPDDTGVTRRQRKYAEKAGVPAEAAVLAALPCLCQGHYVDGADHGGPCCGVAGGLCVTCEARRKPKEGKR